MRKSNLVIFPFLLGITGCSFYQAQPLSTTTSLLPTIPHLTVVSDRMPLPELASHPFNPDDGLDMTEVAILAVLNNPDLRAVRDSHDVAQAQLMAAGALPNPQITAGLDHPTDSGPGLTNAFNFGVSYDIGAIIAKPAAIHAARADAKKVDWSILWQEWQVVQKSRLLFIQISSQEKMVKLLQKYRDLLTSRYQRAREALAAGDLTIDAVSSNLADLQSVISRLNELERKNRQSRNDLNVLVGVAPSVTIPFAGDVTLPVIDTAKIAAASKQLTNRRPDLLALQAGYESQEQQFREAVLAQFPALNIGFTRSRDTSDIYTSGLGVTLTLPIFGTQSAIAVARATRQQLRDEYQARLDTAFSEIDTLVEQIRLTQQQQKEVAASLPELAEITKRASEALDRGDMDFPGYSSLQAAFFEKQIEEISLSQAVEEQNAVLQTLLGIDFSTAESPSDLHLEMEVK